MKYSTLQIIQLLIPISRADLIETNPSLPNVVIDDFSVKEINALNVKDATIIQPEAKADVVIQLPRPYYTRPEIFDSICSQINVSAISRIKDTDSLILMNLVQTYCSNRISNIWFPTELSSAMRVYKATVNSEEMDRQEYHHICGEKAMLLFHSLYNLLDQTKELLMEDTPLAFCEAMFRSLQIEADQMLESLSEYESLANNDLKSSLICDCLSFSKDSKNICALVETMSWNEFFNASEEYLFAKSYVLQSLLNIIYMKYLAPEEFNRMVESGTFEVSDTVSLRRLASILSQGND